MATHPHRLRAEDVPRIPLADPASTGYELVDGQLVAVMPAQRTHAWLSFEISRILGNHLEATRAGRAFHDVWCRLPVPGDPELLRAPDLAYFSQQTLAAEAAGAEIFHAPPDLVIEIFSPSNQRNRGDFQKRVRDYLDAGVRLLWVIYPDARYAMVHRSDGSARLVRETEALDGEDVLPGFSLEFGDLLNKMK